MKKLITFITFFGALQSVSCQTVFLKKFNKEQAKINRRGLAVLGGWGAANIIYSAASLTTASKSDTYFYRMNILFGSVNLTIGSFGYLFSKSKEGSTFSQSLKKQMNIEKLFLFNTGLDIVYVATGFYLKDKKTALTNTDKNRGFGEGIILQGAALFLFDGIMYVITQHNGRQLYRLAEKVQVGIVANGVGCTVTL